MFLRMSAVFSIFDRGGYNSEGSTLSTLEQNLRSHPSYIGIVPSRRFTWEETIEVPRKDDQETMVKIRKPKTTSTRAIIIDYDKFKELYNIDFRRTYIDESTPIEESKTQMVTANTTINQELPFDPMEDSYKLF